MPVIPGYRILGEIAGGASGTVYRAEQEGLSRIVALKVLSPGLFDEEATRARFLREAKLQARLSHPRLLALYDAGFAEEQPYLAMELVEGGTLRELLTRACTLAIDRAAALAAQVAEGLGQAHQAGIAHRDLKPENVLLLDGQHVKIADFGLAKAYTESQTLQTADGIILGTPGYLAPEAIRGEPSGPPADVYALGVMLYEMLAGCRPFDGPSLAAILAAQLDGKIPALSSRRPGVPEELESLMLECLERDSRMRPNTQHLANRILRASGAGSAMASERLETPESPTNKLPTAPAAARTRAVSPRRAPVSERTVAASQLPAHRSLPELGRWFDRQSRLGLALGFGLLLAGVGYNWRLSPQAIPARQTNQDASITDSSSPLPLPALPAPPFRILRAAAGVDRVRLAFDRPLPPGTSVTLNTTSGSHSAALAGNETLHYVAGLRPGQTYQGQIASAGTSIPITFRTLDRTDRSRVPILSLDASVDAADIAVSQRGDLVSVAWCDAGDNPRRVAQVGFRSSPDMGATWWPARRFGGVDHKAHSIDLAATHGSFWLGWVCIPLTLGKERIAILEMHDPWEQDPVAHELDVGAAAANEHGSRAMAFSDGPGETIELAACIGSKASGSHTLGLTTLVAGRRGGVQWTPATTLPDHREICLVPDLPRKHILAMASSGPELSQIVWSWSTGRGPGGWGPARAITTPSETPSSFGACVWGRHLLVAYATSNSIWTRRLGTSPEDVSEPIAVSTRPGLRAFTFARETRPVLVARPGVLYLAYFALTAADRWKLLLLRGSNIAKLVPLAVLDLDDGAPKSLAVSVGTKQLLAVWTDNRGIVRAWRVEI